MHPPDTGEPPVLFPGISRVTTLHIIPNISVIEKQKGGPLIHIKPAADAQISRIKEIIGNVRTIDIVLCGASQSIDLTLSATGLNRDTVPKGLCRGLSVVGFKALYGYDKIIDAIAKNSGKTARHLLDEGIHEEDVMTAGELLLKDVDALLFKKLPAEGRITVTIVGETPIINLFQIALPPSFNRHLPLIGDGESSTVHFNG